MSGESSLEEYIEEQERIASQILIANLSEARNLMDRFVDSSDGISGGAYSALTAGTSGAPLLQAIEKILSDAKDLPGLLRGMRSSWMPIEILKSIEKYGENTVVNEAIPNSTAAMESYENAFMRMLGMPSSNDISDCQACLYDISSDGSISLENTNFDEFVGRAAIRSGLWGSLNKRQEAEGNRVSNAALFDYVSGTSDPMEESPPISAGQKGQMEEIVSLITTATSGTPGAAGTEIQNKTEAASGVAILLSEDSKLDDKADVFVILANEIEGLGEISTKRLNRIFLKLSGYAEKKETIDWLHEDVNFYKHVDLLFPPFQDGDIGTCINEPSKIVAEPFLPRSQRTINGATMKSTLLEAVIRLRMDTVSGTLAFAGSRDPLSDEISSGIEMTIDKTIDSMGIIEGMVISRMWQAVIGMVQWVKKKNDDLKRSPPFEPTAAGRVAPPNTSSEAQPAESDEQARLRVALLFEESAMTLFGIDSSPLAIELQANTQRSSDIGSAHFMGNVMKIVGANQDAIRSKLTASAERREAAQRRVAEQAMEDIMLVLGTRKGVGILDLMAFSIALFSMPGGALLGLLNDSQYENMKREFPSGAFDFFDTRLSTEGGRRTIVESANEVTFLVNGVYKIFKEKLGTQAVAAAIEAVPDLVDPLGF
jgi:hypothetical protein